MMLWLRLLVPIGIGLAAGLLNWMALSAEVARFDYVRLKTDVRAGELLEDGLFESIECNADWKTTAIPYARRGILYGLAVPRDLKQGDLLLWRDVRSSGNLDLKAGETALNLSLDGIPFEPGLIRIGSHLGFAIGSRPDEEGNRIFPDNFELLGPFRIVSVGERTNDGESDLSTDSRVISVAASLASDGRLGNNGSRLLAANLSESIVAVTYYPPPKPNP